MEGVSSVFSVSQLMSKQCIQQTWRVFIQRSEYYLFCVCVCARNRTQGLTHAGQALYSELHSQPQAHIVLVLHEIFHKMWFCSKESFGVFQKRNSRVHVPPTTIIIGHIPSKHSSEQPESKRQNPIFRFEKHVQSKAEIFLKESLPCGEQSRSINTWKSLFAGPRMEGSHPIYCRV